jgi:tRNA 5-methylaminomethyl-2-thiouridine biosynthesis bifunctional protein
MTAPATPWAHALVAPAWTAQASWTTLDTGFGAGDTFLDLWQSWRTNPQRPRLLHYVGVLSLPEALQFPRSLTGELGGILAAHCYDLEPGFHRVLLDGGQVSLTLCVGDLLSMLAQQAMQADCLVVAPPAAPWDKWQVKALARCCQRGAQLVFTGQPVPEPQLLLDAGFSVAQGGSPVVYSPRWPLRRGKAPTASSAGTSGDSPQRVAVVGAGMAGASVARALALRGFAVDVYDTQPHPAGGASGMPVGLVVPHHSVDDSPRSRMSRRGTRLMLQHASDMLQAAQDWRPSGVLELAISANGLTDTEAEMVSEAATTVPNAALAALASTGWAWARAHGNVQGLWHPHAAWIKPARLVTEWLKHPCISFHGLAPVHTLVRMQDHWLLSNAQGAPLGSAHQVVFANAYGCVDVVSRLASEGGGQASSIPWVTDVLHKLGRLQHVHGTLSHGPMPAAGAVGPDALPAFPVNGHGSFVSGVPTSQGPRWFAGSTFQSETDACTDPALEHAANLRKLQALLPAVAQTLQAQFAAQQVQAWTGSRCVAHDRLPLVGPLDEAAAPTLWLCAGMGARGLSFSALCAELLAAEMCGEPLPLESRLAKLLSTRRPRRARAPSSTPRT